MFHIQICPLSCPVDVFYFYREGGTYHENFIKDPPKQCVLAAITDSESLAGAVYALPPNTVAITQGYFPIADYISHCYFDGSGKEEIVENCNALYNTYFKNFEGTDVLSDYDSWIEIDYPIKSGLIVAAVGSGDGKLRPVPSWNVGNSTVDPSAWDGAVYECCPGVATYCTPEVPKDDDDATDAPARRW